MSHYYHILVCESVPTFRHIQNLVQISPKSEYMTQYRIYQFYQL